MRELKSESIHHPLKGALWMVFAGMLFAMVNVINQYLGFKMQIASTNVAFYQYLIALLVMLPWLLPSHIRKNLHSNKRIHHLIRVAFAVAGIQFWTWALSEAVPIWQAIALVMTSPLFATIGSALFLGEKVNTARWLATLAGFIGAMLILEPWTAGFSLVSLLPVVAAIFWAAYSLMVRDISHYEPPENIVFYLLILMTPFNLVVNLENFSWPDFDAWKLLLVSGILTALAQLGITRAYSSAEASFVQPFDHLKLPLNVLAGWVVFSWVPPGKLWVGAVIIIGSSLALAHWESKAQDNTADKR